MVEIQRVSSFSEPEFQEQTERKRSDEQLELSELIFENMSGEESDSLSCCDGKSQAIHAENLMNRGVTRQIGKYTM